MQRRAFLFSSLALGSAGLAPQGAWAALPEAPPEDVFASLQQAFLTFDVRVVAQRMMRAVDLPRRVAEPIDAALAQRDTSRGLLSVQDLMDDDALASLVSTVMEDFAGSLRGKLWLLRTVRRAPQTPEAQRAWLDGIFAMFDLDLTAAREAVAGLPEEGLGIVYGPVTSYVELGGLLLREPYALLMQLAHGRRAREVHLDPGDPIDTILEVLLDPSVRHVLFTGHGSWTGFSLYGYAFEPREALAQWCTQAAESPKAFLRAAAGGLRRLGPSRAVRNRYGLEERQLQALVDTAFPTEAQRAAIRKDLVVRHTCGHGRYGAAGRLIWKLLPESLDARVVTGWGGFSAASPEHHDTWEADMEAWLADKALPVTEQPSLGECFVASPEQVRGFEGSSWIPDFVQHPLPAYRPPHAPWAREPVADAVASGE